MNKTFKRLLSAMICCVMLAGLLAGCGSDSGTSGAAGQPESDGESAGGEANSGTEGGETPSGGADRSQALIIYTNSGSDGRQEWLTERAAQEGFNINVMHLGAAELTERLLAEKNNQIADVVFGLNAMNFERIKAQDILIPYTPAWVDKVDVGMGDAADGYYYPLVVQALLITYNTNYYTPETAPKDFTDLQLGSEWDGLHHIMALTGGTCQSILSSILVRYTDPDGQYGISDEGWAVMESYIKSGQIDHDDWWGEMLDGTLPVCMLWSSGLLQRLNEYEVDYVDYVIADIGAPFVVEQIGICNNSDKQDLAQEFIDWFGSGEVQAEWAQAFDTYPANVDAQSATSQQAQDLMNSVTQQDIDWAFVGENVEYWIEKIMLEFV